MRHANYVPLWISIIDRNLHAVCSILLHVFAVRIRMSFVTLLFRQAACHHCSRPVWCAFVTQRAQFNLLVLLYNSGNLWCGCTTKPCSSLIMRWQCKSRLYCLHMHVHTQHHSYLLMKHLVSLRNIKDWRQLTWSIRVFFSTHPCSVGDDEIWVLPTCQWQRLWCIWSCIGNVITALLFDAKTFASLRVLVHEAFCVAGQHRRVVTFEFFTAMFRCQYSQHYILIESDSFDLAWVM